MALLPHSVKNLSKQQTQTKSAVNHTWYTHATTQYSKRIHDQLIS